MANYDISKYIAYFNGDWVPYSEVKIDPLDRGFFLGDSVFEVERTFNGKSFKMREHIERLYRSLSFARIDPKIDAEEMINISEETINKNLHLLDDVGDFLIHQFITRGFGRRAAAAVDPTVCVRINPIDFERYPIEKYYSGGHCAITSILSYPNESIDPKVKNYSRMNFNLAELEANDIDEGSFPILKDQFGNITEGIGYNVFIVTDGVLRTPSDKAILQGVSRSMVFDLAERLNIKVLQEDLQPYDVYTADEVFMTSTPFCVLPITVVDNRKIKDGNPGPIANQLLAAWSEVVGLDIVDQVAKFSPK
ncbi:MAG: aminotransferase class IV [SAR202 cluster bacterium]|nr:aminotransferase class IV [SAR202 cluster bacterium]